MGKSELFLGSMFLLIVLSLGLKTPLTDDERIDNAKYLLCAQMGMTPDELHFNEGKEKVTILCLSNTKKH